MSTEEEKTVTKVDAEETTTEVGENAAEEETPTEEAPKEEAAKEEESTAIFAPVVELKEVEVKSGEEEEEALFSVRAKLFIYGETLLDVGTGKKSWRERGTGEVRLLRHREHQRIRLIMRQEKTMKVTANHVVDPRILLQPNAGSDRSWVWTAFDFSSGELVETVFAMRFADSDVAGNFKTSFLDCQSKMKSLLAGDDATEGGAEADEVAAALSELKTTE